MTIAGQDILTLIVVALISFLAGYFEYIYLLLLIILIHECGHCIFGMIEGIKVKRIEKDKC